MSKRDDTLLALDSITEEKLTEIRGKMQAAEKAASVRAENLRKKLTKQVQPILRAVINQSLSAAHVKKLKALGHNLTLIPTNPNPGIRVVVSDSVPNKQYSFFHTAGRTMDMHTSSRAQQSIALCAMKVHPMCVCPIAQFSTQELDVIYLEEQRQLETLAEKWEKLKEEQRRVKRAILLDGIGPEIKRAIEAIADTEI